MIAFKVKYGFYSGKLNQFPGKEYTDYWLTDGLVPVARSNTGEVMEMPGNVSIIYLKFSEKERCVVLGPK